jgi:hypothetical protein
MFIMVRGGQYVYQVQVVVASAQWLSLEGVLHFLAPNRDQVSISIILRQQIWYRPVGAQIDFFRLQYTSTFSSGSPRFFDFHQRSILYYLYVHFYYVPLSI